LGGLDPEPPGRIDSCEPQHWSAPESPLTLSLHPGAVVEMRSLSVDGGHGHQATYDINGNLIRSGLGAGSADFSSPLVDTDSHYIDDVRPFIWAAQLDANPIYCPEFCGSGGVGDWVRRGTALARYQEVRPAVANTKTELRPGKCECTVDSAPVTVPPASVGPAVTLTGPLVGTGGLSEAVGQLEGEGYVDSSLTCEAICLGGQQMFVIKGDITPAASWKVLVSTQIVAAGPNGTACGAVLPRPQVAIDRSISHELRHVFFLMEAINSNKAGIGTIHYASADQCTIALAGLKNKLVADWAETRQRQLDHCDFAGWPTACVTCQNGEIPVESECGTYAGCP
jgi:hypothetical protein